MFLGSRQGFTDFPGQQRQLLRTAHCAHYQRYRHFPTDFGRVACYPIPSRREELLPSGRVIQFFELFDWFVIDYFCKSGIIFRFGWRGGGSGSGCRRHIEEAGRLLRCGLRRLDRLGRWSILSDFRLRRY